MVSLTKQTAVDLHGLLLTLPCQGLLESLVPWGGLRVWVSLHSRFLLWGSPLRPPSCPLTSRLDVLHNLGCEAPIVESLGAFLGQRLVRVSQLWHGHFLSLPKYFPIPAENLAGAEGAQVRQPVGQIQPDPLLHLPGSLCSQGKENKE